MHLNSERRRSPSQPGYRLVMLAPVLVFALAATVPAQSGRRSPSRSPAPVPQPSSSPAQTESKSETSARIHLLVGVNETTGFSRVPLVVSDNILDTCVRRLAEAKQVAAAAASRHMTRAEAVKAAKAETTGFVVWLEVISERDEYGADVGSQSNRFYVNFTIYEPVTAKVKQTGRVQQASGSVGNVGISVPTRGAVYSDSAVKETARKTAERILEAFQIRPSWPM